MDYLYRAIEKARRKRDGNIGKIPAPGTKPPLRPPPVQPGAGVPDLSQPEDALQASGTTSHSGGVNKAAAPRKSPSTVHNPVTAKRKAAPPAPAVVHYSRTRKINPDNVDLIQNRVIAGEIDDPRAEAYRQLRSQVLSTLKRHRLNTLAITSAHPDAGKTLTAVNLAISISLELNQTVLLVDLDLREPNVHTTLNLEIEMGIVDHLRHGEALENILVNPGYPRLVVLPGLPQGHHSSELLTSPEMQSFLDDITLRYSNRIIIFDLPPLLRNDDAMAFAPKVDACLLVVEEGVTTASDMQRCMQLLKHSKLLGTILNKAR
ncbi:MAG: hypothetical protein KDI16_12455 [Halioglobus sp.]|nr:hypothetical protein [Halioglobus sp.]